MEFEDLTAPSNHKSVAAFERLQLRVQNGAKQQELAIRRALSMVIVDRKWSPNKMVFVLDADDTMKVVNQDDPLKAFSIHNHALGQMASVIDVARGYVTKLRTGSKWKKELLVHILNEHYAKELFVTAKGEPIKYLRRAVGTEIRGFQGQNFNRSLATAPLLKTFVEECGRWKAGPIEAATTDVSTMLKCVMPYVFEPVKGEFIAIGASFSNSDFGAGKLAISSTIMRISSGTISITDDVLSKVHIGKVATGDDGVDLVLSEDTIAKELEAHRAVVKDMVKSVLSPESVNKTLKMIQVASDHGIEWYRLRTALSKVLKKEEIDFVKQLLSGGDDLMDLPPVNRGDNGELTATSWWAANVVGWFANKEEDAERKHALQSLAGEMVAA